jgi:hypothetical protein
MTQLLYAAAQYSSKSHRPRQLMKNKASAVQVAAHLAWHWRAPQPHQEAVRCTPLARKAGQRLRPEVKHLHNKAEQTAERAHAIQYITIRSETDPRKMPASQYSADGVFMTVPCLPSLFGRPEPPTQLQGRQCQLLLMPSRMQRKTASAIVRPLISLLLLLLSRCQPGTRLAAVVATLRAQ